MATLCTKSPSQAISIGQKVLGYLQRTVYYGLVVNWQDGGLTMYCDAAFAPQGSRSHGGWVVMFGGIPIAWRSSRQSMITPSTAESELPSMLDGAVAAKGVECILSDAGVVIESRPIASLEVSFKGVLRFRKGFGQPIEPWKDTSRALKSASSPKRRC